MTSSAILARLSRYFRNIIVGDFEYGQDHNGRPEPRCFVGRDLLNGSVEKRWLHQTDPGRCPFPTDSKSLWIFYYSSGDLQCMRRCGWPVPVKVLDIFAEFHCLANDGERRGLSLLDAAHYFGLESIGKAAKDTGRELAIRGGPYSQSEQIELLNYCLSDVNLETEVFLKVLEFRFTDNNSTDYLYILQAINRGRYFKASAMMEHVGIPIKRERFQAYRAARPTIIRSLVREYDPGQEIWDDKLQFHNDRFLNWLNRSAIPWSLYPSGFPVLADEYFKAQAELFPKLAPIMLLRSALKAIPNRKEDLQIGEDGFARCVLSAFRTKTGRTHPRASHFIFGRSLWERQEFLGPPPGFALAYVDYEAQELGVLAALSGDKDFRTAYLTGDLHLTTAKNLGWIPRDGTKANHPRERAAAKVVNFAIIYGSGPIGLASKISPKFPPASASALIQAHRQVYPTAHEWLDNQIRAAYWHGYVETCLGWRMRVNDNTRINTLRNWSIQATAGEITREAVCRMVEAGLQVCCPVHDAVLIIAPDDRIEQDAAVAVKIMQDTAFTVLGFPLLVGKPEIVRYPDTLRGEKTSHITAIVDPYLEVEEEM